MTQTIHHATARRAAKLGITLIQTDGKFEAFHPDVREKQYASTATDALDLLALSLGVKGQKASTKVKAAKKLKAPKATRVAKPSKKKAKAPKKGEDAAIPANRSVVRKWYKDLYAKNGGHSGSNISKALTDALLGEGPGVIGRICKENGVPFVWQHLDIGRQRMCLGTVLKGRDNRSEPVVILGKRVKN